MNEQHVDALLDDLFNGLSVTSSQPVIAVRQHDGQETTPLYEYRNPKITLNLHSGQWQAWHSTARTVAIIAGTQGGKTSFGPWWLLSEIYSSGRGDYIAATSSYDLFKLKMLPEMLNIFVDVLGIGRYWRGDKVLEIRNPETGEFDGQSSDDPKCWARVILRSAAAKGGLESTTAKAAWLDEAGQDEFSLQAWEAVRRRLALSQGRCLITTTPYNLGWLKTHIYDRWLKGQGDIEVIQFASAINPLFPAAEMDEARQTMPYWKFAMFYKGLFERPAGLIFEDFINQPREQGGHLYQHPNLLIEYPRTVGVDPGIINETQIWVAHDPYLDLFFVYREKRDDRKPAVEHAREALHLAHSNRENVVKWAVGAKSEIYHRKDWLSAGARGVVEPPESEVEARIDAITMLFKQHRLFISPECQGLIDELNTYRREVDENGDPTVKIHNKSAYHHIDALGYAALHLVRQRKVTTIKATAYQVL